MRRSQLDDLFSLESSIISRAEDCLAHVSASFYGLSHLLGVVPRFNHVAGYYDAQVIGSYLTLNPIPPFQF
jgi:hypothetical protein